MTSHFQLYGRPSNGVAVLPPLSLSGSFDDYNAGENYDGRLLIVNGIGKCYVEYLEGYLPPGFTLFVDNITHEVVLRWPGYSPPLEYATQPPNNDFEQGDVYWRKGVGWAIEEGSPAPSGQTQSGTWSAVWTGSGTADLISDPVPVEANKRIQAQVLVQQGASSSGNAGAQAGLQWYDTSRNPLGAPVLGYLVKSGSNSEWHPSGVDAVSPPQAAYVSAMIRGFRKSQNKRLWVDDFTWDHKYAVGTQGDEDFWIRLRVRDSANRVVEWFGYIMEAVLMYTSAPYAIEVNEAAKIVSAEFTRYMDMQDWSEGTKASAALYSVDLVSTVVYTTYSNWPAESVKGAANLAAVSLVATVVYSTYSNWPAESVKGSASLNAVALTVTAGYQTYSNYTPEGVKGAASLIGITLT